MSPSSTLPSGRKPASFGSMDWLSQSSRVGPSHTSRPAAVSRRILPAPAGASSSRDLPQTVRRAEKCSEVSTPGTPTGGWSKDVARLRAPRARTAFSAEQVSTLESAFQHRRYLGPAERRRLAREMRLSEVQIKTWFQNRRMKHKRQLQDCQLSGPFSGVPSPPVPFCPRPSALGSGLQLPCPWASPPGPPALGQPPGSFWDPCQVEQACVALAWASCSGQPLMFCLPDPGGQAHTPGPALSRAPWDLCALPHTEPAHAELCPASPWRAHFPHGHAMWELCAHLQVGPGTLSHHQMPQHLQLTLTENYSRLSLRTR